MGSGRRPGVRVDVCLLPLYRLGGLDIEIGQGDMWWVIYQTVGSGVQDQEGLRIRSGRSPWAQKTHMKRLGPCVKLDGR